MQEHLKEMLKRSDFKVLNEVLSKTDVSQKRSKQRFSFLTYKNGQNFLKNMGKLLSYQFTQHPEPAIVGFEYPAVHHVPHQPSQEQLDSLFQKASNILNRDKKRNTMDSSSRKPAAKKQKLLK